MEYLCIQILHNCANICAKRLYEYRVPVKSLNTWWVFPNFWFALYVTKLYTGQLFSSLRRKGLVSQVCDLYDLFVMRLPYDLNLLVVFWVLILVFFTSLELPAWLLSGSVSTLAKMSFLSWFAPPGVTWLDTHVSYWNAYSPSFGSDSPMQPDQWLPPQYLPNSSQARQLFESQNIPVTPLCCHSASVFRAPNTCLLFSETTNPSCQSDPVKSSPSHYSLVKCSVVFIKSVNSVAVFWVLLWWPYLLRSWQYDFFKLCHVVFN